MQMAAFTLKLSKNINKINDLLEVDKNIKKGIVNNSNKIVSMNESITNNFNRISINDKQGLEPCSSFFPAVFGQTVSRCST